MVAEKLQGKSLMTTIITKVERRKRKRAMISPTKDTFKGYTVDSKLDTLYDFHIETIGLLERTCERVDVVEAQQKRWKIVSGTIAIGSGFLGGAAAMLAKLAFWK